MYYVICSSWLGIEKCVQCINLETAKSVSDSLKVIYGPKRVWITKVVDTNGEEV